MEPNLPATREDLVISAEPAADRALPSERPLSGAFLPLAIVTFLVIAFVMAAWTFLSTAT